MSAITLDDFLRRIGIDPEHLKWQDLAICRGAKTNLFFDDYESSTTIANQIDVMCLQCPVSKECYEYGTENKLWGVFGGFYLSNGIVDKKRNEHKKPETISQLAGKIFD